MTPLPHSSQLNAALAELIGKTETAKTAGFKAFASSPRLKHLYRLCNATDAVLDALDEPRMKPSMQTARTIVLNQPILLLYSFTEEALVDLRRFVELAMWNVYFTDHPIEWREFLETAGFSRDLDKPIAFCAHRELGFYISYAKELMQREPSGLASTALDEIQNTVKKLNKHAHGATLAPATQRAEVLKDRSDSEAKQLCEFSAVIFSNVLVVLCAAHRQRFDSFGPAQRAYFDYLMGMPLAKRIRAGQFGLLA